MREHSGAKASQNTSALLRLAALLWVTTGASEGAALPLTGFISMFLSEYVIVVSFSLLLPGWMCVWPLQTAAYWWGCCFAAFRSHAAISLQLYCTYHGASVCLQVFWWLFYSGWTVPSFLWFIHVLFLKRKPSVNQRVRWDRTFPRHLKRIKPTKKKLNRKKERCKVDALCLGQLFGFVVQMTSWTKW